MARVLIVDDSALSRRLLRAIVEVDGHEVFEATDGLSALEQYYLQRPAVVFLDLIMAGMKGIEVLAKLRELDPQARVIVATADIQKSSVALAQEAGAAAYVTKPFDRDTVLATLREQLAEVAHPKESE